MVVTMGVGGTELGVPAREIRRTIFPSTERHVEAKVGPHLLMVHQHSAIFSTFFQAPVVRVKLWPGFFNVSVALIGHRTSQVRVSAMPHAIMARLAGAQRSRVLRVPTRVRGIDDGMLMRLLR